MIFRRKKHPLPRFPNTVIPTFKQLARAVSEEEARAMIPQIDECLSKLKIESQKKRNINLELGIEIANTCRYLLSIYPKRSEKERALIIGAVRYFAFADDPFSETDFATGFDDDACVINHVLEALGIEERYLGLH